MSFFPVGKLAAQGVEIRWFSDGEIPPALSSWFVHASRLGEELPLVPKSRTDLYFIIAGVDSTGLKLREGELELKLRYETREMSALDGRIQGLAEVWRKSAWDYPDDEPDPVVTKFSELAAPGRRAAVKKWRHQRKFVLSSSEVDPTPVALATRVAQGCAAELTRLESDSRAAWTLAVETLGTEDFAILNRCVTWILKDVPEALPRSKSRSYPGWLALSLVQRRE